MQCVILILFSNFVEAKSTQRLVDESVLEVKSSMGEKQTRRAIYGVKNSKYYFNIETLTNGEQPKFIKSEEVVKIKGGDNIKLSDGWIISSIEWSINGLEFNNEKANGSLITIKKCLVSNFPGTPIVKCD